MRAESQLVPVRGKLGRIGKLKISTLQYTCMCIKYFYTCKESSQILPDHNYLLDK